MRCFAQAFLFLHGLIVHDLGCVAGAARRRRERRLHSWLQHERVTVRMDVATVLQRVQGLSRTPHGYRTWPTLVVNARNTKWKQLGKDALETPKTEVTRVMTKPSRRRLSVGRRSAKNCGVHTSRAQPLPCRRRCGKLKCGQTPVPPLEGAEVEIDAESLLAW